MRPVSMITASLKQGIDAAYPHRLWSKLIASGARLHRDEVIAGLLDAQVAGEATVTSRRWSAADPIVTSDDPPGSATTTDGKSPLRTGTNNQLMAVRASVRLGEATVRDIPPEPGELVMDWSLFRRLLPYYSECLRIAANSGLTQFPDRHRLQFQLLRPESAWWPRPPAWPILSVSVSDIDPGFLEGLYKRRDEPVFIGYPTEVVATSTGEPFLRPIAVLRAEWQLEGTHVAFRICDGAATFNPDWLSGMRRNRRMARVLDWLGTTTAEPGDGVLPVSTGEWASLEDLGRTLAMFMARDVRERLDPHRASARLDLNMGSGVFNAAAIYLVEQNRYTAGVRRDLAALSRWSDADLEKTALSAFFGKSRHAASTPVLPPLRIGEDQLMAARDALAKPLTVITGPPGSGKSQAAAAIMASAALSGQAALFSSRQHQALDAVEGRFRDMLPDRVLLARARQERDGDFDFKVAIDAILSRAASGGAAAQLRDRTAAAEATWRSIDLRLAATDALNAATAALADAGSELARLEKSHDLVAGEPSLPAEPFWTSLWQRLLAIFVAGGTPNDGRLPQPSRKEAMRVREQARAGIAAAETVHRRLAEEMARAEAQQPLVASVRRLIDEATAAMPLLADAVEVIPAAERARLASLRGELGLARDSETARRLWAENADLITRQFPLWAVTALSVPARMPLQPALFDYVIVDEATTCDIAAAIPLLARARHAVIVGDPMQTGLVADLHSSRETPLLEKAGLLLPGIGRLSFSQTSLFGLASTVDTASRHILRDHFRCQSDIAEFISEVFYGRRLTVLTDEKGLRPPAGVRPGLHWTDVSGPVLAAGNGCISNAEATAIAAHLRLLIDEQGYDGTVGVVTPFKKQAERIRQLVEQSVTHAGIDRVDLRIATGHSFQGDERDVVLISPCFSATTPQGSSWFIRQGASLFNVAVSRARAVCHVFGDLEACRTSDIRHLAMLARRVGPHAGASQSSSRVSFESPWEEKLHDALRARGLDPQPQYPLAGRRLDLALINNTVRLDIEVDGDAYHRDPDGFRKVSDIWRDHQIRSLGWRVQRFWVYQLRDDMEGCVDRVVQEFR